MNFSLPSRVRGFTLIELLVVISIIALLSSVVLASVNSSRIKARDAKRLSDRRQIRLALELLFDQNGSYPSSGANWRCFGLTAAQTCWRGSYTGLDALRTSLLTVLSAIPTPGATGSDNYATDAYLYNSNEPALGVQPTGAYLIWYQERKIQQSECNTGSASYDVQYDAYWYCYEFIGAPPTP